MKKVGLIVLISPTFFMRSNQIFPDSLRRVITLLVKSIIVKYEIVKSPSD